MRYFGTDGIRGTVGTPPITVEFVLKLGWAVGQYLKRQGGEKVVIGKDTRISGYMFEAALEAGLSAAGVNVYLLGPVPTPAIAYLTSTLRAHIGIVISASHNPYPDNGIKFFSADGTKLNHSFEEMIELSLEKPLTMVGPAQIGKVYRVDDSQGRYIEFCKSALPHYTNFKGLKIVLDCANGATYSVAPILFEELRATVKCINIDPNGININNKCGSTDPNALRDEVLKEKADLGIAFDGDGDRVIMVDHKGEVVDGDELLFIIAHHRHQQKKLVGGVVGTLMSNIGLERALRKNGIAFKRAEVGDKYILEMLQKEKWYLGGEASGHIICLESTTTGDGIISALQVLLAIHEERKSLHDLKSEMHKCPQVMRNIACKDGKQLIQQILHSKMLQTAENKLNGQGRLLVRASGTEPVIRLLVEGSNSQLITTLADEIQHDIEKVCINLGR